VQKLWLKDFEFHINPVTWQAGQALVQNGQVKSLREVEKHFWVALVEAEEGSFETEVMLTPNKIRAFTCECWTEGRRLMCPHIVAALLKVRQFLEQRAEERRAQAAARPPAETTRLTVQSALENATPEALLEFVREYARRDRDFGLALKTWFASGITGTENPFLLVLDAVVPRTGGSAKAPRDADLRRLRKTLDDLQIQLESALAERTYRLVFQIASAILQKAGPLVARLEEPRRAALLPFVETALHRLTRLPAAGMPPELREAIWNALVELSGKGQVPTELERETVFYLSAAAEEEEKFGRLRELFDRTPYPAPPLVLHLFVAALARRQRPEAAIRVLEDYREKPSAVKDAVVQLYYLRQWDAATAAGEHFLAQNLFNPAQRRELEDLMLLLAEKTGDRQRQIAYLRRRFVQNGLPDTYLRLKTAAAETWSAEYDRLVQEVRSSGNLQRLAALLAAEGKTGELTALLREAESLTLLQQFEDLLLGADRDFLRDQYSGILGAYLSEHFGRQASGYVRDRLAGLLLKGETELVLSIIRDLTARFGDRHTLPGELAELLPKSQRKAVLQP
jgi:hypothetical protein